MAQGVGVLRGVHRGIGGVEELVGALAALPDADADVASDVDLLAGDLERGLDRRLQPAGQALGLRKSRCISASMLRSTAASYSASTIDQHDTKGM